MNPLESVKELIKPMVPGVIRKCVWKYRSYRELLRFLVRQRRLDFQIEVHPWLDEASSEAFLEMLEKSSSYLEYGSGGSTVVVARLGRPLVSVDTDRYFLKAVRRKVGELAPNQHIEHGNIGWTKQYGYPLFERPTLRRQKMWKAYVELPWRYVNNASLPELVMIDGRFRVAAALTSCIHLKSAPASRIVVDDYVTRPYYHVIEEYAQLVGIGGRMAIFKPPLTCSPGIEEAIEKYALDWR
jgi:hypothetical protein